MLFDDYLAKVVEDDSAMIACLVIPEENITRVWAGHQQDDCVEVPAGPLHNFVAEAR